MAELSRALAYPKIRSRVNEGAAAGFIQLLRTTGTLAVDPPATRRRSKDPGDDYLVALAESEAAILVSGDRHLLALAPELPILAAAEFLGQLRAQAEGS